MNFLRWRENLTGIGLWMALQETSLPSAITVCIAASSRSLKGKCLGYIDPATNRWVCQVLLVL